MVVVRVLVIFPSGFELNNPSYSSVDNKPHYLLRFTKRTNLIKILSFLLHKKVKTALHQITTPKISLKNHSHLRCLLLLLRIPSAHLGSGPRYSGFLRGLHTNTKVFLRSRVYKYAEKQIFSKGYRNPNRKLGLNHAFFRDNRV